jgi:hypothetical protein
MGWFSIPYSEPTNLFRKQRRWLRNTFYWPAVIRRWRRRYLSLRGLNECGCHRYCGDINPFMERTIILKSCPVNFDKSFTKEDKRNAFYHYCPKCAVNYCFIPYSRFWAQYVEQAKEQMNSNCTKCPNYAACLTLGMQ